MKNLVRQSIRTTSFLAEEGGTELVELALSSVLLFTLIFGIMDCVRAVYINHYLAGAAREGIHYAMVRGSSWTNACATATSSECTASSSNVSSYIGGTAVPGVVPANLTIDTSWPGITPSGTACSSGSTNAQGCLVNVQVNYAFHFSMPFLPNLGWNMSSAASATILQ